MCRPPRKGHSAAPMAIIVNNRLVTKTLDADIKPRPPERPQAHVVTDYTLRRDKNLSEVVSLHPGRHPCPGLQRRARTQERRGAKDKGEPFQDCPPRVSLFRHGTAFFLVRVLEPVSTLCLPA